MKKRKFISLKKRLILLPLTFLLISTIIITLSSSYFLKIGIQKQLKRGALQTATEISRHLNSNESNILSLTRSVDKKLMEVSSLILKNKNNIKNSFFKEISNSLDIKVLNYYNNDSEIIFSNNEDFIGLKFDKEHPVSKFSSSGKKTLIEKDIRKATVNNNYYKFAYRREYGDGFLQIGLGADYLHKLIDEFNPQKLIMELVKNENVAYALIMDSNAKVLASSDPEEINCILNDEASVRGAKYGEDFATEYYYDKIDEVVYDVIKPFYSNRERIGAINIGLRLNEMNKTIKESTLFILIVSIISFLTISFILYHIGKSLSSPIKIVTKAFNKLANGDISVHLDINRNDEIGLLAEDFNIFSAKLSKVLKKIISISNNISQTSSLIDKNMDNLIKGQGSIYYHELQKKINMGLIQLNHSIETVLDNVRSQTASSEESLASIEEISTTNNNIHTNIKKIQGALNETLEVANRSSHDMEKMVDSMDAITYSANDSLDKVNKLKNLSNNIGTIITSINSVSEQTNLLALNAAIEAARAGEAGRGFSVVADEIRKLAEQTNNETQKISKLINGIQKEVEIVRLSTETTKEKVNIGINLTNLSKENINKIIENNKTNANDINEVTMAIEEQSIASKEINSAIENITTNSTTIESLSIATTDISKDIEISLFNNQERLKELNTLLENLKIDLDFFKL